MFWGTSPTDWTTVFYTALYVGGDQIVVESTGRRRPAGTPWGQWGQGDIMPVGRRPEQRPGGVAALSSDDGRQNHGRSLERRPCLM